MPSLGDFFHTQFILNIPKPSASFASTAFRAASAASIAACAARIASCAASSCAAASSAAFCSADLRPDFFVGVVGAMVVVVVVVDEKR